MNVTSRRDTFTKTLRRFIATVVSGLFIFASVVPGAGASISVFDSLGTATPASQFLASTAGGTSILEDQFVGVQFTVTQPTTLTEIGGFVNKLCEPVCSATPLTVLENVFIDGCDSGITDVVLPGGSTISGLVAECVEGATNHGQFVSCIAHLANP